MTSRQTTVLAGTSALTIVVLIWSLAYLGIVNGERMEQRADYLQSRIDALSVIVLDQAVATKRSADTAVVSVQSDRQRTTQLRVLVELVANARDRIAELERRDINL